MPKKSLTDLLREESEKNPDSAMNRLVNYPKLVDNLTDLSPEQAASYLAELQAALQLEKEQGYQLEIKLKEAELIKEDLAKAKESLQEELQSAQNQIRQFEAELKKAKERYNELEIIHADVKTQLRKLQGELKTNAANPVPLKNELEKLRETARLLAEENQSLQQKIAALEQENQALKHQAGRLVYPANYSIIPKDKLLYNPLSNEELGWFD